MTRKMVKRRNPGAGIHDLELTSNLDVDKEWLELARTGLQTIDIAQAAQRYREAYIIQRPEYEIRVMLNNRKYPKIRSKVSLKVCDMSSDALIKELNAIYRLPPNELWPNLRIARIDCYADVAEDIELIFAHIRFGKKLKSRIDLNAGVANATYGKGKLIMRTYAWRTVGLERFTRIEVQVREALRYLGLTTLEDIMVKRNYFDPFWEIQFQTMRDLDPRLLDDAGVMSWIDRFGYHDAVRRIKAASLHKYKNRYRSILESLKPAPDLNGPFQRWLAEWLGEYRIGFRRKMIDGSSNA